MALNNMQPTLPGFNPQQFFSGLLNQNVKSVDPNTGVMNFHDDTNMINQLMPLLLGGLGGNQGGQAPAPQAVPQQPAQPGQAQQPGSFFESPQGLALFSLLGQLGSGLALPGTPQANIGNAASQFFNNILSNMLTQSTLGGGSNTQANFNSGSSKLGPAVGVLSPEVQSNILQAGQRQEQIPFQNFLNYAQGVRALRPEPEGAAPNLQRVTSSLPPGKDGLPDPNGKVDPRKEYIYSIDPKTNQIRSYITTQVKPTPDGSSSVADKLGKNDVNFNLSQQFYELAKRNVETGTGFGSTADLIEAIKPDKDGNVSSTKLLPFLQENEKLMFMDSLFDMANETKNPLDTQKQVKRLAGQFKVIIDGYQYLGTGPVSDQKSWKKIGK